MGGDIGAGRVQHLAEIAESEGRQVAVIVVLVKRRPAAVLVLHPGNPLQGPGDGLAAASVLGAGQPAQTQCQNHLGGIVNVGVIVVVELKGPAAGLHLPGLHLPVAAHQDLLVHQPTRGRFQHRVGGRDAAFRQRLHHQAGIPYRRNAALYRPHIALLDAEAVQPAEPFRHGRVVIVKPAHAQRNQAVHPGGLDAGPAAVVLLMLQYPADGLLFGQFAEGVEAQAVVNCAYGALRQMHQAGQVEARRRRQRVVGGGAPVGEQFVNGAFRRYGTHRAAGQHDGQGHDAAPGPAGKAVDAEGRPGGQQNHFGGQTRRAVPFPLAEQRQPDAGEHPRFGNAAPFQDEPAGPAHRLRIGRLAAQLQGEVALYRCGQVAGRAVVNRPGAVVPLLVQQVVDDMPFPFRIAAPQEAG